MSIFRNRKAFEVLRGVKTALEAATNALRSKTSKQARKQLAIKDGEIAALRWELVRARGDGRLLDPAGVSAPVFFILGYQRSGTTWLMLMLDAHPEILCKVEGRFFGGDWRQEGLKLRNVQRPPSSLYNAMLDVEYSNSG